MALGNGVVADVLGVARHIVHRDDVATFSVLLAGL